MLTTNCGSTGRGNLGAMAVRTRNRQSRGRKRLQRQLNKQQERRQRKKHEEATKIQSVFRGWSIREWNSRVKQNCWFYAEALGMVHTPFHREDGMCPQAYCLLYLEDVLGLDVVENDPVYCLLEELEHTGYWWNNWAPSKDDDERVYLFKDDDSLEEAMDAIRVHIKKFR